MPATRRRAAEALVDPVGALETQARARARAVLGGVAAGVVLVAAEVLLVRIVAGATPQAGRRELPAAVIGGEAPEGVLIVTLAGVATIVLAAAYGALVALAARRRLRAMAWWTGAAAGLTVYVINFYYLLAPALRWIAESSY